MTAVYLAACTKVTEHDAGRALAEYAASDSFKKRRTLAYDERGKPYFDGGPFVSISHSHGLCLAAVSDREVGADIEKTGGDSNKLLRLAVRYFAADELAYVREAPERRFYEIWTAKESFVKFTGEGLSRPLPSFSVLKLPLNFTHLKHGAYAITICSEDAGDVSVQITGELL